MRHLIANFDAGQKSASGKFAALDGEVLTASQLAAQNPRRRRPCNYLNLRDRKINRAAAHKQVFLRRLRIPGDGRSFRVNHPYEP